MHWLASWWDFVFNTMMGGSVVLMFLFGWEIFLIPITLGIGILATLVAMAWQVFVNRKN